MNDPYTRDLFDDDSPKPKRFVKTYGSRPLARNTDPSTSFTAFQHLDVGRLEQEVCWAIGQFPQGCIYDDVARLLPNRRQHSLRPRFAPLLRRGLIVATGEFRVGSKQRRQRVVKLVKEKL